MQKLKESKTSEHKTALKRNPNNLDASKNFIRDQQSSEHINSLQDKLNSMKSVEIPVPAKIYQKYAHKNISFTMVKLAYEFATAKINHSNFCKSIIDVLKNIVQEFPKSEKNNFKEIFLQKINTFKEIISEFTPLDDSLLNVFEFVLIILESLEIRVEFEESRRWFEERLDDLITEKFLNSEIILIENVL